MLASDPVDHLLPAVWGLHVSSCSLANQDLLSGLNIVPGLQRMCINNCPWAETVEVAWTAVAELCKQLVLINVYPEGLLTTMHACWAVHERTRQAEHDPGPNVARPMKTVLLGGSCDLLGQKHVR